MDIIDNVIFATFNSPLNNNSLIDSEFLANPPAPSPIITNPGQPISIYGYNLYDKYFFSCFDDTKFIEKGIQRHWYDVTLKRSYFLGSALISDFQYTSNYHLIYAYLLENTRIVQIFERLIEKYLNNEELGIADRFENFNFIQNSESIFYKNDLPRATNLRSLIRPQTDGSRRNAYNRMFGMDLAFGDKDGGAINYTRSNIANNQFIIIFERYLNEIWQGYINARNSSGANSTDLNIIVELAQELNEMLIARRGDVTTNLYSRTNLAKEEFSSVLLVSWFTSVISDNSPLVTFLNCQSSTIGERLMKIGAKVGVPAHQKCQSLFEMAGSASTILQAIELGSFMLNPTWIQNMLSSLNPGVTLVPESNYMNDLLTIINNWEKATGHRIKNPQGNITGTVMIKQAPLNGSIPKPVMN